MSEVQLSRQISCAKRSLCIQFSAKLNNSQNIRFHEKRIFQRILNSPRNSFLFEGCNPSGVITIYSKPGVNKTNSCISQSVLLSTCTLKTLRFTRTIFCPKNYNINCFNIAQSFRQWNISKQYTLAATSISRRFPTSGFLPDDNLIPAAYSSAPLLFRSRKKLEFWTEVKPIYLREKEKLCVNLKKENQGKLARNFTQPF